MHPIFHLLWASLIPILKITSSSPTPSARPLLQLPTNPSINVKPNVSTSPPNDNWPPEGQEFVLNYNPLHHWGQCYLRIMTYGNRFDGIRSARISDDLTSIEDELIEKALAVPSAHLPWTVRGARGIVDLHFIGIEQTLVFYYILRVIAGQLLQTSMKYGARGIRYAQFETQEPEGERSVILGLRLDIDI